MQRPILIISMVDKIDPRYTQHITTYNIYLNDIYFLWPIQSAPGFYACYIGGNNFYPAETQRPIFNISMVDKIDPRYTQHITTYNTYLNCICFSRPIESARGLYPVLLREIIFILGKCSNQSSTSLWWTILIQDIHNISQHIILISTASPFYGQFKCSRLFWKLFLRNILWFYSKFFTTLKLD